MKKAMKKQGFTLIELMVVVIIVGILAAVAVPMMSKNTLKSKATEAKAFVGALNTAGKLYTVEKGTAPTALSDLQPAYIAAGELTGKYVDFSVAADVTALTFSSNGEIATITYTKDLDGDGKDDVIKYDASQTDPWSVTKGS